MSGPARTSARTNEMSVHLREHHRPHRPDIIFWRVLLEWFYVHPGHCPWSSNRPSFRRSLKSKCVSHFRRDKNFEFGANDFFEKRNLKGIGFLHYQHRPNLRIEGLRKKFSIDNFFFHRRKFWNFRMGIPMFVFSCVFRCAIILNAKMAPV